MEKKSTEFGRELVKRLLKILHHPEKIRIITLQMVILSVKELLYSDSDPSLINSDQVLQLNVLFPLFSLSLSLFYSYHLLCKLLFNYRLFNCYLI